MADWDDAMSGPEPEAFDLNWEPEIHVPEDVEQARLAEQPLPWVRMSDLAGTEPPRRKWIVEGWLPSGAATLLAGGGGVGKSLMTQQWLTAISLGLDWLGMKTAAAVPTMFVNCEDEIDEIHRRNNDIARALGFNVATFQDFHALSRAGELGNELGTFDQERKMRLSAFFYQIERDALALGVKAIGLDNVAHLFTGNENVRGEVTQFMNACTRLAIAIDGAVIVLGHPAKVEGSTYSGSTSWENAVRSRLFLQRPEVDEGQEQDPNERVLSREKSNYAAKDERVTMVWHHGAFVSRDMIPETATPAYEAAGKFNALFLQCLDECNKQRRAVSHSPYSRTFAPKVFAKMPAGQRARVADFEAAMERLLAAGKIAAEQELWLNPANRHPVIGLARLG